MVSLHIIYQDDAGKAISAVKVNDRFLLMQVAKKTVDDAQSRAKILKK